MAESVSIPIICGPTGSGKSGVALKLSEQFPIEIISADSRQVVKYLNIGTAKPTADEQAKVRHHLIDLIEPGEKYSAVKFMQDADQVIDQIRGRDAIPVIVGGTGLYIKALIDGLVVIDTDVTPIRERLEAEAAELGRDAMHNKLAEIDPAEAARIHPHNLRHTLRALEIYYQTGKIKSELVADGTYKKSVNRYQVFYLAPDREELYDRINRRVDRMVADGWLDEVQELLNLGFGERLKKAEVIGYSELLEHFEGRMTLGDTLDLIRQNTRRFAKRQMTWYRGQGIAPVYFSSEGCLAAVRLHLAGAP